MVDLHNLCIHDNILKIVKNNGNSLKEWKADFIPVLSLLHVFMSYHLLSPFIQWSYMKILYVNFNKLR